MRHAQGYTTLYVFSAEACMFKRAANGRCTVERCRALKHDTSTSHTSRTTISESETSGLRSTKSSRTEAARETTIETLFYSP